jgi:hypothetical protein
MMTDPVYEGKSMQGMIDLVRKRLFPRRIQSALRSSRRRAGHQRVQLHLSQRLTGSEKKGARVRSFDVPPWIEAFLVPLLRLLREQRYLV